MVSGVIDSVSLRNRLNVSRCQFESTLRLSALICIPKHELELRRSSVFFNFIVLI